MLDSNLAPGKELVVKIDENGTKKEFKVTFVLALDKVELVEQTFSHNLANQRLSFKVNGSVVDTDYLALAGYSVNFVAVEGTKVVGTVAMFAGATNVSATGILNTSLQAGEDYTVEIQLIKNGVAVVSGRGTIQIRNTDITPTGVNSAKFAVGPTVIYNANGSTPLTGNAFLLNGSKVVAGETFYVNQAKVQSASEEVTATAVKVKTSNPAVISVDAANLMTAQTAGTATITVEVGDAKKDFVFTVMNEERKLTSVTTVNAQVVLGKTTDVEIITLDQFGDPFQVVTGSGAKNQVTEVIPQIVKSSVLTDIVSFGVGSSTGNELVTNTADSIGKSKITILGKEVGNGTIYFKDYKSNVLGSVYVQVSSVDNVGSQKLEIKTPTNTPTNKYSKDSTIDMLDDNVLRLELASYNTDGVYVGATNLATDLETPAAPYKIEVADSTIAGVRVLATGATSGTIASASGTFIEVLGNKAGTTDIIIKNSKNLIVTKISVTIVNDGPKVTAAPWKAVSTINYNGKSVSVKDVLDLTETTGGDYIVNGLTLSKATGYKVRLAKAASAGILLLGELYIDSDGSGSYTAGEAKVGMVTSSLVNVSGTPTLTPGADIFTATVPTVSGQEGTVIFKILVDADNNGYSATDGVTSTSVNINTK